MISICGDCLCWLLVLLKWMLCELCVGDWLGAGLLSLVAFDFWYRFDLMWFGLIVLFTSWS